MKTGEHPERCEKAWSKADLTLEELLEQARPWIWHWLAQWIHDPEIVADLTQEVLIKVWEARGQWNPKRGFWGWLLRIMSNHYCDWRRRRPQDMLSQALIWEETTGDKTLPAEDPSPEDLLLQAELRREVHTAITSLPPKYREVLWLYYVEDWKCADIASTLNLTLTQVEGRLFRGRSMLRVALRPLME